MKFSEVLPLDDEEREVIRFAFFPITVTGNEGKTIKVWLEWYTARERYSARFNTWFHQSRSALYQDRK